MVTPPGHHSIGSLSSSDLKKSQQNQQSSHPNLHTSHHHHQQQSSALRALQQHMTPSVYEMAALTQDLDTQVITTKIKEALLANNIGQKVSAILLFTCKWSCLHACYEGILVTGGTAYAFVTQTLLGGALLLGRKPLIPI